MSVFKKKFLKIVFENAEILEFFTILLVKSSENFVEFSEVLK